MRCLENSFLPYKTLIRPKTQSISALKNGLLNIHMLLFLAVPHFWLVQPSRDSVSRQILGRHFLVCGSLNF